MMKTKKLKTLKMNASTTCLMLLLFGLTFLNAQKGTKIGAQLTYGTEISEIALGANAEFGITDKIAISPSFNYYLIGVEGASFWELNGNGHYNFINDDSIGLYGLAGLNYTAVSFDTEGFGGFGGSGSNGSLGLNLGAGANFKIGGNIIPFAEIRYLANSFGQLVFTGGVRFGL